MLKKGFHKIFVFPGTDQHIRMISEGSCDTGVMAILHILYLFNELYFKIESGCFSF